MNKRLIFRILGALASALIIVSVFVPFVSVTGYSQSLWQTYESLETLYLPIMIIVFGAIGVIAFAINVKTELAYTSTGALLFFLILQTIPIIEENTFNTLSVGYYFLVIGTLITGVMAFLCNLKQKIKDVPKQEETTTNQVSMLEQIDKLYDEQPQNNNIQENNTLNNIIQPIPVQNELNNVTNSIPPQSDINGNVIQPQVIEQSQVIEPVPIQNLNNIETITENNTPIVEEANQNIPQENGVVQDANQNVMQENPVVQEFNQNVPQGNPVVQEFNQNAPQGNPVVQEFNQSIPQGNPVTAEFNQNSTSMVTPQPVEQIEANEVQPIQPITNEQKVDLMANQTNNNNSNLDIFG